MEVQYQTLDGFTQLRGKIKIKGVSSTFDVFYKNENITCGSQSLFVFFLCSVNPASVQETYFIYSVKT